MSMTKRRRTSTVVGILSYTGGCRSMRMRRRTSTKWMPTEVRICSYSGGCRSIMKRRRTSTKWILTSTEVRICSYTGGCGSMMKRRWTSTKMKSMEVKTSDVDEDEIDGGRDVGCRRR
ncbi:hypothetical protein QJS10_CPA01g02589 [Acorus calamus]|uniref:Uncharacterized protein n=1 Tax=Acorus calamus TaxID=4465 RepID=A0AAV9FGJ5_ACOCL|nr:hypothetical protein QJS10_CPA01g02589 [Acorus calamus]